MEEHVEFTYVIEQNQMEEVVRILGGSRVISLDIETTGLTVFNEKILLIQVGTPDQTFVINALTVDCQPLKEVLENPKILKLIHNASFEFKFLYYHLGISIKNIYCSFLAEKLLTAGTHAPSSLAAVASKYLGVILDKGTRSSFVGMIDNFTTEQLEYAALDAEILHKVYAKQRPFLAEEGLLQVARLEFECVEVVSRMETNGLLIDRDKWQSILEESKKEKLRYTRELCDMMGFSSPGNLVFGKTAINLSSNKQLIEALNNYGLPVKSTLEKEIMYLKDPIVPVLLGYKEHDKILSSFGQKFFDLINPVTGRIHPSLHQLGTDTGRFSSSVPNCQQIPSKDFRKAFIADKGYKLISADYSGQELRILAQESQDKGFIANFLSGKDMHSVTASLMFGIPIEEVDKEKRTAAKTVTFGVIYGLGPPGLAQRLNIEKDEASRLIFLFFKSYKGVKKWLMKAKADALKNHYSITLSGRKRYYPQAINLDNTNPDYLKIKGNIERQGSNGPIQGLGSDICKQALINVHRNLQGYDAKMLLCIHDEILYQVREDQAEEVKGIIMNSMMEAGKRWVTSVPMVVEASISDYWEH